MRNMRIGIAQINCTVGDFKGNAAKIASYVKKAEAIGADIISFPELAMIGYPPEDLLLKARFVDDGYEALDNIARKVGNIVAVVGFVHRSGAALYNSAAVVYKGKIKGVYKKTMLPNYGVFDEIRYFKAGTTPDVFRYGDVVFGVNICEDIWHKEGPAASQAASGAGLIININSSPYYAGKVKEREDVVSALAKDSGVVVSYANLVGGQDELIFDGQSMIVDQEGRIAARAPAFTEELLVADIDIKTSSLRERRKAILVCPDMIQKGRTRITRKEEKPLEPIAEIYEALTYGLKDYVMKNGFSKVVIGLSGGIDSSLVAALAADALGKGNVVGVFMPTRYSSKESESDAKLLASNLGIMYKNISIENVFKGYLKILEPQFRGLKIDSAEENIQARIRGNVLMALSNKFGWLVLTTGNKSEMSTGYATLYGDMAGGFAVIKDVLKTLVYKLAGHRNSISKVIPESVIVKEPTAELRPNQKDSDTLPAYNMLDKILKAYIVEDKGFNDIVAMGFDKGVVQKVMGMVDNSEYKRRQSPPGIKITPKAFGRDRRMPITNKYR